MWVLAVFPAPVRRGADPKFPCYLGLAHPRFAAPLRGLPLSCQPFIRRQVHRTFGWSSAGGHVRKVSEVRQLGK
jgi:hypothetical protein